MTALEASAGAPRSAVDPGRTTAFVAQHGTALLPAGLSAAVLAALAGGLVAKLGVGLVVAVLAIAVARAVRRTWHHRAVSGIAVLLLIVPLAGLVVAVASDARSPIRVAKALDVVTASAFAATAVLVFIGVRRLTLAMRRRDGTPWATLAAAAPSGHLAQAPGVRMSVAGVALAAGAVLGIALAPRGFAGTGTTWASWLLLSVLVAAAVITAPALAAVVVVGRRDRAERERALHRQAVAAHLHDSVLQTFALVQRRLDDPDEVRRLIRRQERELRDWLAGRDPRRPDSLGGALQQVVDEIEAELHVSIELEVLGDRPIDPRVGQLVDAAREALRNAARHGDGAPIRVLAAADGPTPEVYVRDEGPGFVLDAVPTERRGIRDAIIGRMAAVGGSAVIDAVPGAGTEVVLRLPTGTGGER